MMASMCCQFEDFGNDADGLILWTGGTWSQPVGDSSIYQSLVGIFDCDEEVSSVCIEHVLTLHMM